MGQCLVVLLLEPWAGFRSRRAIQALVRVWFYSVYAARTVGICAKWEVYTRKKAKLMTANCAFPVIRIQEIGRNSSALIGKSLERPSLMPSTGTTPLAKFRRIYSFGPTWGTASYQASPNPPPSSSSCLRCDHYFSSSDLSFKKKKKPLEGRAGKRKERHEMPRMESQWEVERC